jgi:hypothetical protein
MISIVLAAVMFARITVLAPRDGMQRMIESARLRNDLSDRPAQ